MPPLPPRGDMRKFLMTPGPHNGPVTCFIIREKSGSKLTGAQKYPKVGGGTAGACLVGWAAVSHRTCGCERLP